jgi:predicted Zn finger-like uncharacterized protein
MAKEILCPICGATYNLAEEQLGKKVRCKKCEHAFTAGGEPRRRAEDDDDDRIRTEPGGRSRSRARRDRDRDDRPRRTRSVEEQAKPRSEQEPGLPLTSIILTCVALGVLVLCCGGGAGVYFLMRSSPDQAPNPLINQAPPFAAVPNQQPMQGVPPANNPPLFQPPAFQPPAFQPPVFPGGPAVPAVTNMKEALDAVRDPDPGRRIAGAQWLGRAQRDEARAVEVSKALDPLVRDGQPNPFRMDGGFSAALSALKVWGTTENVPTLVDFLKAQKANEPQWIHFMGQIKDAMEALARIGDDRAVDGILPFAGSIHGIQLGGAHEQALRKMGSKAEPGLLRYYDDPNPGMRNLARGLLQELRARPDAGRGR